MKILQNRVSKRLFVLAGSLCACLVMMSGQLCAVGIPRAAKVKIDSLGNMVAIWEQEVGGVTIIQAANRAFADSSWSIPQQLSVVGLDSQGPELAINSSGEAVAIWLSLDTTQPQRINRLYAATIALQATPTWTTATVVSTRNETVLNDYKIELNNSSQAVIEWLANSITPAGFMINSATSTINSGTNSWSTPVQMSGP